MVMILRFSSVPFAIRRDYHRLLAELPELGRYSEHFGVLFAALGYDREVDGWQAGARTWGLNHLIPGNVQTNHCRMSSIGHRAFADEIRAKTCTDC